MYGLQYSSENRCRRCNRELSDKTAQYGWRCAEIMGISVGKQVQDTSLSKANIKVIQPITGNTGKASDWDREHLNGTGVMLIEYFKKQWKASYLAGDIEGMNKAHDNAVEIRLPYLKYGEIITPDGNVINLKNENGMYDTPDDAAFSFVYYNNPKTHEDIRERGGYIFEVVLQGKRNYFFKESLPAGGHADVVFNALFGLETMYGDYAHPVAFVHTHPKCTEHSGNTFSSQDKWFVDLGGLYATYLGTPVGELYAYTKDDPYILLSKNMPKSKKPKYDCIKKKFRDK